MNTKSRSQRRSHRYHNPIRVVALVFIALCSSPGQLFAAIDAGTGSHRFQELNREDNDLTPLMRAARQGRVAEIRMLIASGVNVNERDQRYGTTALIFAAGSGHVAAVSALLDAGADVNLGTYGNNTALTHAVQSGSSPTVELLVRRGADVNVVPEKDTKDETALSTAVATDRNDIARFLLENGADVDVVDPWEEWSPIALATLRCNKELVDRLIAYGASPEDTLRNSERFAALSVLGYRENFLRTAETKCPPVAKVVRNAIAYTPQLPRSSLTAAIVIENLFNSRSLRIRKEGSVVEQFLRSCPREEVQLIRNAIFARKNYAFTTPRIREYFERHFSSYQPKSTEVRLTKIDKENIGLISNIEKGAR